MMFICLLSRRHTTWYHIKMRKGKLVMVCRGWLTPSGSGRAGGMPHAHTWGGLEQPSAQCMNAPGTRAEDWPRSPWSLPTAAFLIFSTVKGCWSTWDRDGAVGEVIEAQLCGFSPAGHPEPPVCGCPIWKVGYNFCLSTGIFSKCHPSFLLNFLELIVSQGCASNDYLPSALKYLLHLLLLQCINSG